MCAQFACVSHPADQIKRVKEREGEKRKEKERKREIVKGCVVAMDERIRTQQQIVKSARKVVA